MLSELQGRGVEVSSVSLQASYIASVSLVFEVVLSTPPEEQSTALANFTDYFFDNSTAFGGYQVLDRNQGSTGVSQTGKTIAIIYAQVP